MIKPTHQALMLLLAAGLCSACGERNKTIPTSSKPVAVTVARPLLTTVSDTLEFDGVVMPSASVNLVARVAGFLQEARFLEGDPVRAGQLLFVIEPEPYRQQLKLNRAREEQMRTEAERQASLLKENATSQASLENARSQLLQAEANTRLAQINLGYTEVRAPNDGVIGKRTVDVGNFVGAAPGGTVLGTIQTLRPASVSFAVTERDLLRLRSKSQTTKEAVGKLAVRVRLQGESMPSAEGVLDFIDNNLSAGTGTIALRARFPNTDLHLIPGLYARVSLNTGAPRSALLLPNSAIQSDQQGSYVYVVDSAGHATRRKVRPGQQFGAQREVLEGLAAEERVVVNGLANLSDGLLVALREEAR